MDYAKDFNGREISAGSPEALPGRRYSCINCDKQVTLRAKYSSEKRPYFAHLPGVANTDVCKLYVQSTHDSRLPRPQTGFIHSANGRTRTSNLEMFSATLNIYIHNKNGAWGLSLVLKLNQWQRQDSGHILIEGASGNVLIDHNQIRMSDGEKIPIKINFNFNVDSIQKNGPVDQVLWSQLTENPSTLNPLNAVYMSTYASGRKLVGNEKIRKDFDYVYVSSTQVQDLIFLETISEVNQLGDIHIYKFRVPPEFELAKQDKLKSFLERDIVDQPPKFSLKGISPVDVDIDGTYIIPKSTEYFYLETDGELEVKSTKRPIERAEIDTQTRYDVADTDDFMIVWKNYPLIRFEKGSCQEKSVNGIKIIYGDKELDLLDSHELFISGGEVIEFSDELFDKTSVRVTVDGVKRPVKRGERLDKSYKNLIIDANCYGYIDTYQEDNHHSQNELELEESPNLNLLKFMGLNLSPYRKDMVSIFSEKSFLKQRKYHSRMLEKVGGRDDFKKN